MKIKIAAMLLAVACSLVLNGCRNDDYAMDVLPTVETIEVMLDVTDPTAVVITENTEPINSINHVTTEPEIAVPSVEPEVTEPRWKSLGTFRITAYCSCAKCCGEYAMDRPVDENGDEIVYTASGEIAEAGVTIAVDPNVIPYGTRVVINGHTYTAQDAGGSIKGNRIDVYFDDHTDAWNFGVKFAEVFTKLYFQEEAK